MATSSKKSGRLTIQRIIDEDINSWGKEGLEKNLPKMIKLYNDRARTFKSSRNKNVFSYALDKMESMYPSGVKEPKKTGNNRRDFAKQQELAFRIQEFFRSKTSSEKGAREVQRDQDRRIFGEDVFGNPKKRMTYNQRQMFWSYFDEFMIQHPEWAGEGARSFRALEVIGEMVSDGKMKTKTVNQDFLNEAAYRYRAKMEGIELNRGDRSARREVDLLTIKGSNK